MEISRFKIKKNNYDRKNIRENRNKKKKKIYEIIKGNIKNNLFNRRK